MPGWCTNSQPWLPEFDRLQSVLAEKDGRQAARFVVMRPHQRAGLGNRIRAVLGAFHFALLTRRALVLDYPKAMANDTEAVLLRPNLVDWAATPSELSKPVVLSGNRETFLATAEPAALWPSRPVVVMDGQNHDMSKALLANANLDSLRRAAQLDEAANATSAWRACALRALFAPGPRLEAEVCRQVRSPGFQRQLAGLGTATGSGKDAAFAPWLGIHLRSESPRTPIESPAWNSTLDAVSACAQALEGDLRAALAQFVRLQCIGGRPPGSDDRSTAERDERERVDCACRRAKAMESNPQWMLMADHQTLVKAMRQRHPDRVLALDDATLRRHSGLNRAGNATGRVMGESTLGPLVDLSLAAGTLALVGTAGSSFSEVAALLAGAPPAAAMVLLRTPFMKSSQGEGMKVPRALEACERRRQHHYHGANAIVDAALYAHVSKMLISPGFTSAEAACASCEAQGRCLPPGRQDHPTERDQPPHRASLSIERITELS